MTPHIARVQPESKFVNVTLGVLLADVMIDAIDAALHYGPNRLYAVRVDRASGEVSRTVIDSRVFEEQPIKAGVARMLVTVDRASDFDVVEKALLNRTKVRTVQNKRLCVAATLAHSQNGSLADRTTTHVQLFVGVLIDLLAADERLVNFDDALEFVEVFSASLAQSVEHKPRALLSDADLFGKLHRTDTLARRHQQVHSVNPLVKRNVTALEYRSGANGKSELLAAVAAVVALRSGNDAIPALALRTDNAIRPQAAFQIEPRGLLIWEPLEQLKCTDCAFAHALNIANFSGEVKYIIPL